MKASTKKLEQWHEVLLRGKWPFTRIHGDWDLRSLIRGAQVMVCMLLGHDHNDCHRESQE